MPRSLLARTQPPLSSPQTGLLDQKSTIVREIIESIRRELFAMERFDHLAALDPRFCGSFVKRQENCRSLLEELKGNNPPSEFHEEIQMIVALVREVMPCEVVGDMDCSHSNSPPTNACICEIDAILAVKNS
ncbi:hypothetical protein GOB87_12605 [Acetobacter estunensis]|uniref:Uncharacterized protein n=1 Tax=Acetobacter estunensis TaxID=104097 RepID=A0A967EJC9_9PROT|nr:hypothetical protein [Acetobacter estunensis]NHO54774.1 hypothetical protein [Acetobacter estunensis]